MKKIAACYIRVSTDDQIEYSPQSQLREIKKYAKQHDFFIPDEFIFTDEGISGRNTSKRPEFNRMISIAKKKPKPFDAVLLWKFSRFARNRTDAIVYKNLLRNQCGIDVISISENLGEDKGTALILESMFEAMDEYYSINLSTEVKRSMQMKAENGEALIPAPFGYKNENKKFVVDHERAEIVKTIFNSYENGNGFRKIAVSLANMGVRTKRGNVPDNRFVEYILRNPFYIGKIRWSNTQQNNANRLKGELANFNLYQGKHQPIISEEQFERVQKIIEETANIFGKYQRKEAPKDYILKGLVRCGTCGATLIKASTTPPAFQCHNYARGSCHVSHSMVVSKMNNLIVETLKTAVEALSFDVELKNSHNKSDFTILKKMLDNENKKLSKVKLAYEEGIDTLEEYKLNKAKIATNIAEIEKELAEQAKKPTKTDFAKKTSNVLNIIQDSAISEADKNTVLRTIISKVVFYKPENHIRIFFYA